MGPGRSHGDGASMRRPGTGLRRAMTDMQDGWEIADPASAGLDAEVLAGLGPQFEAWTEANLHAALIVRHGQLVYERYFAGEDQAFGKPLGRVAYHAGLKHDLRSITKSIASLLVGIALERGRIRDLDASVLDFFPECADLRTPEKAGITLRHLLTMSAGLAWNEMLPYSNPANSERRMMEAPDPYRYVLEQPLARRPGATYSYNGGLTMLLAAVVERSSGRSIDAVARDELFAPLGIEDVEWVRYPAGIANAASGLRMRPRDLARIGQMVLARGLWAGRRVVPADWIEQSLAPQVNGESLFFYGFHWWLGRSLVNRREISWASATGWGGQRMFIVPSLDMVVLAMAGLYD